MIETKSITEFDELNSHYIHVIISAWTIPQNVDCFYNEFLASLHRNKTLTRFDSNKASFNTFIVRCLKNFLYMKINQIPLVQQNSVELLDSLPAPTQEVSKDFKLDLFSFYKYYSNKIKAKASDSRNEPHQELTVLKYLFLCYKPTEIAAKINKTPEAVHYYRRKIYKEYKRFLKS